MLASKIHEKRFLGLLWKLLSALGAVLERLGLILERLGGILERLRRILRQLGAENSVLRPPGSHSRSQDRRYAGAGGGDNIKRRRKTSEGRLQKIYESVRPGYSEPRHAAGRLRARCGSKTPQSGEPATALGSGQRSESD